MLQPLLSDLRTKSADARMIQSAWLLDFILEHIPSDLSHECLLSMSDLIRQVGSSRGMENTILPGHVTSKHNYILNSNTSEEVDLLNCKTVEEACQLLHNCCRQMSLI